MVHNKRPAGGSLTQPTNGVDRPMKRTDLPSFFWYHAQLYTRVYSE